MKDMDHMVRSEEHLAIQERLGKRLARYCFQTPCSSCPMTILGLDWCCQKDEVVDLMAHILTDHAYDGAEDIG